jgi:hypothetical protein
MKTILEYKYYILSVLLLVSLTSNIFLLHSNRIYERGILRAMDVIGIPENPNAKWSSKLHLEMFLDYLEGLDWSNMEEK